MCERSLFNIAQAPIICKIGERSNSCGELKAEEVIEDEGGEEKFLHACNYRLLPTRASLILTFVVVSEW